MLMRYCTSETSTLVFKETDRDPLKRRGSMIPWVTLERILIVSTEDGTVNVALPIMIVSWRDSEKNLAYAWKCDPVEDHALHTAPEGSIVDMLPVRGPTK